MSKEKRIYAMRANYLKKAVTKRRKMIRKKAVLYKGAKCKICGYKRCFDAFDFHHVDESQKKFGISQDGLTRSWERVQKELDKCVLLCSNCHREVHLKIAASTGNRG